MTPPKTPPPAATPDGGEKVLVVDFGGQYAHLIARRLRELKVYSELVPPSITPGEVRAMGARGLVFSGGPASVYARGAPSVDRGLLDLGLPTLGICYGAQLLSHLWCRGVARAPLREYGRTRLQIQRPADLFPGVEPETTVWMSHGDRIDRLPPDAEVLASTENSPIAAFRRGRAYGVQFHPEVQHTPRGRQMLSNFLFQVCGCQPTWDLGDFIERSTRETQGQVGDGRVLLGLSGGVDSSTAALLLHRALGPRLVCIFVDHGLLRKGEVREVQGAFRGLGIRLHTVDSSRRFLQRLKGVSDPEEKRRIIGREFIRLFEEEARRLQKGKRIEFLAQGTIYPDRIESAAAGKGKASRIKTHHNVAGLPADMKFKLVEPLRDLYKDEVREVARRLGLPDAILRRHPFPGPGLAARIIGEATPEKLRICRDAGAIVEEELKKAGWYEKVWQAFAVVGDDLATGVLGDERALGHLVTVRVVESVEAMTADYTRLPWELLDAISHRITNEVPGVTWVAYAISSKPPATIEPT